MFSLSQIPSGRGASFAPARPAVPRPVGAPDEADLARRLVQSLDCGDVAALAFDAHGTLIAINLSCDRLLRGTNDRRALLLALSKHRTIRQQRVFIWRRPGRTPCLVRSFAASAEDGSPSLAIVRELGEQRELRLAEFVSHHGVTAAEARLLDRILRGERLQATAEEFGLSLSTVKSQLRSLLARTGVGRQTELIALFYAGQPPTGYA